MENGLRVILDAGGDHPNGFEEILHGGIEAAKQGVPITFSCTKEQAQKVKRYTNNLDIDILEARRVIPMNEEPSLRQLYEEFKDDNESSIVVAAKLAAETGWSIVTAGNRRAAISISVIAFDKLEKRVKPVLSGIVPSRRGVKEVVLCDMGAATFESVEDYVNTGKLCVGEAKAVGRENPTVALLNIGTEPYKGKKAVYKELSNSNLNFVGNVEPNKVIIEGLADIVLVDGSIGNHVLKLFEGIAEYYIDEIKEIANQNIAYKFFGWCAKKLMKKGTDPRKYSGALLLGVNGKIVNCHGESDRVAIKYGVIRAWSYAQNKNIIKNQKEELSKG